MNTPLGGLQCRVVDVQLRGFIPLVRQLYTNNSKIEADVDLFKDALAAIYPGPDRHCCMRPGDEYLFKCLLLDADVKQTSAAATKRLKLRKGRRLRSLKIPFGTWRSLTIHIERTHATNQKRTNAKYGRVRSWKLGGYSCQVHVG